MALSNYLRLAGGGKRTETACSELSQRFRLGLRSVNNTPTTLTEKCALWLDDVLDLILRTLFCPEPYTLITWFQGESGLIQETDVALIRSSSIDVLRHLFNLASLNWRIRRKQTYRSRSYSPFLWSFRRKGNTATMNILGVDVALWLRLATIHRSSEGRFLFPTLFLNYQMITEITKWSQPIKKSVTFDWLS